MKRMSFSVYHFPHLLNVITSVLFLFEGTEKCHMVPANSDECGEWGTMAGLNIWLVEAQLGEGQNEVNLQLTLEHDQSEKTPCQLGF